MSLNFAGISPHPPIIIPEIGSQEDLRKVAITIQAMRKMANIFQGAEIDTLIIISPHMLIYPDKFNIAGMKKLFGSFASFGAPEIMMEFANDLDLASKIDQKSQSENINTLLYNNNGEFFELDHGVMVPLHYLTKGQESPIKIVPIAYSNLSRANHFTFGQIIGEIAKNHPGRIGILASGDLSHRLIQNPIPDLKNAGQEFDDKVIESLKLDDTKKILYFDEEFVEDAGECAYRSILILLGALDGMDIKPDILSYEGPFGVGYLVANYKIDS